LFTLAKESGADTVFWNRRYEPAVTARDATLERELGLAGIQTATFNAALLHEPLTVQNKSGKPFQVFSAFWRACLAKGSPPAPLAAPSSLRGPRQKIESLDLAQLELEPTVNWADGIRRDWRPGAVGANAALTRFLTVYRDYLENRNRPDLDVISRLSPHLHFGELSPRQVWHALQAQAGAAGLRDSRTGAGAFATELGWREFAHHLLYHFPHTPTEPLRSEFARFPWCNNPARLHAWQEGRTGYPLVDAGMRQLWATGWMHNRVRMVVASFLVKNLLIPWQEGAKWFWDTLVDADLANNTLGWQWSAGCGADAAPYFRIFNPVTQGQKFDPDGNYVRRWIPELRQLPARYIHQPWTAPSTVLAAAGVRPGQTYPEPLVSLLASRETALAAYQRLKLLKNQLR
jgi:deoxyribodipyrimidine photo-lyase